MSGFYLSVISGYSIFPAVIIGLVRFTRISKDYRPFIAICILALSNESVSLWMIRMFKTNAVNANIYILIEFLLYCWQFHLWSSFTKKKRYLLFIIILLSLVWVYEMLIAGHINTFSPFFRIGYSVCLVFLGISQINTLMPLVRGNLFRNPVILICTGLVIFYSFKSVIEVFYWLRLSFSESFYGNIYFMLIVLNIFVNLIFALALLWIPTKQKFTLPYQ